MRLSKRVPWHPITTPSIWIILTGMLIHENMATVMFRTHFILQYQKGAQDHQYQPIDDIIKSCRCHCDLQVREAALLENSNFISVNCTKTLTNVEHFLTTCA